MIYLFSMTEDAGAYQGDYFYDNAKIYNLTYYSIYGNKIHRSIYDVDINNNNQVIFNINKSEFNLDFKSNSDNQNIINFVPEDTITKNDATFIKILESEIFNKILDKI